MRFADPRVALCILLLAPAVAAAKVFYQVVDVDVTVMSPFGREFNQPIKVTIWRDSTRKRAPFLVFNHGRPADPEGFKKMGRVAYTENSKYFVEKGFVVLLPTRVGYGVSGGEDMEFSGGSCSVRNYPPAFDSGAQQTVQLIEYARTLRYVDATRGLVAGQSYGGVISLAVAARNVDGVAAAVNFAGGGGGDPQRRAGEPCRPDQLRELFASYGGAKVPTLWLYAENDLYFGKTYPRQWFDAFAQKGGKGKFVMLPPLPPEFGPDGHATFTRNPEAWRPVFEEFLKANGF